MNVYSVDWVDEAECELAEIWLQASDPDAVTRAQDRIDQLLARNPAGHGSHMSEGLWQLVVPPLAASYTIDDDTKHVEVTWVARIV